MEYVDGRLKQGAHADPLDPSFRPPDPATLPDRWRAARLSRELAAYRKGLLLPDQPDLRAAILDDLSSYYGLSPEECVRRCLDWEQWSVEEWHARARDSQEALADFYNTMQSWSFDLLWFAYLQAEGCVYPTAVVASRALPGPERAPRCLDFGSGVGDTAQLLLALGYEVELADISKTLLAFARYRLERRGQQAAYVDLNEQGIAPDRYDVIFAKDVLVHVPDFDETVGRLHRALRPGGLLLASFDTRPPSPENAWHFYTDDLPLRRRLQDVGFVQQVNLDNHLFVYRRVEPAGLEHLVRRGRNAVLLGPLRRAYRDGRAGLQRARSRLAPR